eukprot:Nk52_evm31s158 gene=Nk52_evmTU31s158
MARSGNRGAIAPKLPGGVLEGIENSGSQSRQTEDLNGRFNFRYKKQKSRKVLRLEKKREQKKKQELHRVKRKLEREGGERLVNEMAGNTSKNSNKKKRKTNREDNGEAKKMKIIPFTQKGRLMGKQNVSEIKSQKKEEEADVQEREKKTGSGKKSAFIEMLNQQNLISEKDREKYGIAKPESYGDAEEDDKIIAEMEKKLGVTHKSKNATEGEEGEEDELDYILGYKEDVSETESGDEEQREDKEKRALDEDMVNDEDLRFFGNEDDESIHSDDVDYEPLISDVEEEEEESAREEDDPEEALQDDDLQFFGYDEDDESIHSDDEDYEPLLSSGGEEECEEVVEDESHKEQETPEEDQVTSAVAGRTSPVEKEKTKYIPPHLRNKGGASAETQRLKRQVKGLMNKLTEQNIDVIVMEMEKVYVSNSRNIMNEILSDIVIELCVDGNRMMTRLLLIQSALVTSLFHLVGLEVGASFIQTLAQKFNEYYTAEKRIMEEEEAVKKECVNILCVFCYCYNFQMIHSSLVYDFIKLLLANFREQDVEMLLLIVRICGFQLRQEDPAALKDIIVEIQERVAALEGPMKSSSRVRFMLETIYDVKNNKKRLGTQNDDSEAIENLKKVVKIIARKKSATGGEKELRVSYEELIKAGQKGRWWIVGSAWVGNQNNSNSAPTVDVVVPKIEKKSTRATGDGDVDIAELARIQKMNTDVRRAIFSILMTADDFVDAYQKLLKLGLKNQQEREIVRVIIECCLKEKAFNPYYAHLSSKFCKHDYNFKFTFQYCFWDKFKAMDTLTEARELANLSSLLCFLISDYSLSLAILKVVEFTELNAHSRAFFRLFFCELFTVGCKKQDTFKGVLKRLAKEEKLAHLKEGIVLFLRKCLKTPEMMIVPALASNSTDFKTACGKRIKMAKVLLREDKFGLM